MIRLVAFDLDDTLYKEMDFVYGAFGEVCIYLSNKYNITYEELFHKCTDILKLQGRGKIFNILCEQYSINESIERLVEIYQNAVPMLKLYEDVESLLMNLKNKVYTGIITDGKASVQWNKIKCLGLDEKIDRILVTDDFGKAYWKPHCFAFEEMLRYFNIKSSEALYIGDNPNKDFVGARAVGYTTIRLIREYGDYMTTRLEKHFEADHEIRDLREVLKYI